MTDPDRTPHTSEPAEGDEAPGRTVDQRTPHTEEPAEGRVMGDSELGGGADTPDNA
ncbi:hypothetical protein [Geodermatophilus sp. URMC 64]